MFAKTVPVFHWKLHFLRPQLVTLPRDLYHKKAAQCLSKMKTEIENLFELGSLNDLLRARFKQFLLRLSCARVLVCVIQKDFNFDWLTNNALRWQTNSQEAFLANIILRTARERRKRKTRAFAAGSSVLSPSRAPLAQPLKKITGASFWNSERLPWRSSLKILIAKFRPHTEYANKTGHYPLCGEVKFIDRDPHW